MSDFSSKDCEQATEFEEQMRADGVAKMRTRGRLPEGWNGISCIDCDDPLPELRVQERRPRCVTCQSAKEKREKLL